MQCITRDGKFVPGAGATEVELAIHLAQYADTLPGLEQYAVRKFASALESFPKALADNSGLRSTAVLEKLLEAHQVGTVTLSKMKYMTKIYRLCSIRWIILEMQLDRIFLHK